MKKETLDEQVHDASAQGRAVGNDGSPPGEITINELNQDDDDDSFSTWYEMGLIQEKAWRKQKKIPINEENYWLIVLSIVLVMHF